MTFIDGNNLWHATQSSRLGRLIGRQHLVVLIDRWAARSGDRVTVVFDGPTPRGSMADQMRTPRVQTRFSGRLTADEVLVEMIEQVPDPGRVRVVTSDRAIQHEARARRCAVAEAEAFIEEMLAAEISPSVRSSDPVAEGNGLTEEEVDRWVDELGEEDDASPPYWQIG